MKQKFFKNDLVRIANPLPEQMSHFGGAGKLAYVLYSYEDEYGPQHDKGYTPDYALDLLEGGHSAWYPESVLSLVKRHGKCPTCGQSVEGR
jgi:hypothetical protein